MSPITRAAAIKLTVQSFMIYINSVFVLSGVAASAPVKFPGVLGLAVELVILAEVTVPGVMGSEPNVPTVQVKVFAAPAIN